MHFTAWAACTCKRLPSWPESVLLATDVSENRMRLELRSRTPPYTVQRIDTHAAQHVFTAARAAAHASDRPRTLHEPQCRPHAGTSLAARDMSLPRSHSSAHSPPPSSKSPAPWLPRHRVSGRRCDATHPPPACLRPVHRHGVAHLLRNDHVRQKHVGRRVEVVRDGIVELLRGAKNEQHADIVRRCRFLARLVRAKALHKHAAR